MFRDIDCPYSNRGLGFALPRMFDPSYTRDPPRGNGIPEPGFPTVPFALENIRFENMRVTEERGRAVYASAWCDSPEARIVSGPRSVSVGAAAAGTARRVMLRYDHEYGLMDWGFGYRVRIGYGDSVSLVACP